MNRIDCALRLAHDGWPVFPLVPGGRLPYADEGVTFSTCEPDIIRAWFAERPDMNYGVDATGALIVDIDNKDGKQGSKEFAAKFGGAVDTFAVRSPNNGLHLYYRGDGTDYGQAALLPGVDVRAYHGYVVGPGSAIEAGTYSIAKDVPAADIPAEIRAHISEVAPEQYLPREQRQQPIGELDTDHAISAGVDYLAHDAPPGSSGSRNETGFRVACVMKDLGLSAETIGALMCEHWDYFASVDFGPEQVYALGKRAHLSGRERPGVRSAGNDFGDIVDDGAMNDVLAALGGGTTKSEIDDSENPEARDARLLAEAEIEFADVPLHIPPEDVPKRRWFVQDVLSPGLITGIVAPPGVGKSTFMLNLATGLSVGDLSGMDFICPEGRKRTLFLSVEDDPLTQYGRAWAAYKAHGHDPEDARGWLKVPSDKFQQMTLLKRVKGHLKPTTAARKLALYCKQHEIDVLVLDPWVDMSEGDENQNAEVQRAVALVREVARTCEIAVVIVHHSRKTLAGALDAAGDANIVRGAGALNAALRATFTLLRPSSDDLAENGFTTDDADSLFRFDRAKGSYSPPGRHTKWFRSVSVLRPCDHDGGVVSEPAVERVYPDEQQQETRRKYADLIGAEMMAHNIDKLPMKDAVAAVLANSAYSSIPAPAMKKALDGLFSGAGVTVEDGVHIRLAQLGNLRAFVMDLDI